MGKLKDTPRGIMTVPRSTIKTKTWVAAQFLEISNPSPKKLEYSSYSLAYEITHPYILLQLLHML